MGTIAELQDADNRPPRRLKILPLTVTSTATAYDLTKLQLGEVAPSADGTPAKVVYLNFAARGADIFYQLSDVSATDLDDTAAIAVGGPLVYSGAYGVPLPDGSRAAERIDRSIDKFLIVKTPSGTSGKLFFWASSSEETL